MMKGTKLYIQILLAVILFLVVAMFIISGADLSSWSEGDLFKATRWLIILILVAIARMWWKFADNHKLGNKILLQNWHGIKINFKKGWIPQFKIIKTDYTLKSVFEVNGWLFVGIAVFGLSVSGFMHYMVTILAALTTFITVLRSVEGKYKIYYTIGLCIGVAAWVIGFVANYWSVYLGEVIYFITPAIWVLNESEKVE